MSLLQRIPNSLKIGAVVTGLVGISLVGVVAIANNINECLLLEEELEAADYSIVPPGSPRPTPSRALQDFYNSMAEANYQGRERVLYYVFEGIGHEIAIAKFKRDNNI